MAGPPPPPPPPQRIKVKAIFTVYRIACAPPRKSYRIGLLFTQKKNGCGGVISVTKRGCASARRSLKCRVTCWIHVGVHTLYRMASHGATKAIRYNVNTA